MLALTTVPKVERLQPVVPFAFVAVRLKPPMNEPQVRFAPLSRSPMFLPVIVTVLVVLEQTSKAGSVSPISVRPPCPSAMDEELPTMFFAPLFWPEITSIAPGDDGP